MSYTDEEQRGQFSLALPPAVEEAYRKKCVELERRIAKAEESNDAYRLRKPRPQRDIRKSRLERAFFQEILDTTSMKSGSIDRFAGPEKPLRCKRSRNRSPGAGLETIVPRTGASLTREDMERRAFPSGWWRGWRLIY